MHSSPDTPSVDPSPVSVPEEQSKASASFCAFSQTLDGFATEEEKISYGLQFMREAISQEGNPRFRDFWEARRVMLSHFKEYLNPAIRSKLWNEYVELTVEARRLKEIFEEQSAFSVEQIDLAIQSIVADLENFDTVLSQ